MAGNGRDDPMSVTLRNDLGKAENEKTRAAESLQRVITKHAVPQ